MDDTLLLISDRPDDLAFARAVAAESGMRLLIADSAAQARNLVAQSPRPVIFSDVTDVRKLTAFKLALQSLIGRQPGQIDPNDVHFIGSECLEQLNLASEAGIFGHIIVRNFRDLEESGRHYARILRRVSTSSELGLGSLFSPSGTIKVVKVAGSTQKDQVLEHVGEYLNTLSSFGQRTSAVVETAVDELLLNAIYDAPEDARAQATPGVRSAVELQMGANEELVAFTVIDRFGSLDKIHLLDRIVREYRSRGYEADEKVGRAGVGLATTFRMGGSLYFMSRPGVKTEVTVFFKRTASLVDFKQQFRFISIHSARDPAGSK